MEPEQKKSFGKIISYGLIILLTAEVVFLIVQNRKLENTLKDLSASSEQIEPLKSGERVEPFSVQTLDGNSTIVKFSDPSKKHLLFVLSTTCPHCEKTLPFWKSLAKTNDNNCDILGVSIQDLQDTRKFLESKDVGFYTVSAMNDNSFIRKYKIGGVPETILINGNGTVQKAWVGELTHEQIIEIQILMSAQKALIN